MKAEDLLPGMLNGPIYYPFYYEHYSAEIVFLAHANPLTTTTIFMLPTAIGVLFNDA